MENENRDLGMCLKELQEIFQIREEEFQKREQDYQAKRNQLKQLLGSVASQKEELEKEAKELAGEKERLQAWEEQLAGKEKVLQEQEEQMKQKAEQLQGTEKELLLKHSLELEKVRNEKLKLKRLTENYEFKISLLDDGVAEIPQPDLSEYIPLEEHCSLMEEKEGNIRQLKEERVQLLRKVLELTGQKKQTSQEESVDENQHESEKADKSEDVGERKAFHEEAQMEETLRSEEYAKEELTPDALESYLRHQKKTYSNVEIRHSDQGELVYADGNGLQYRFLFATPGCFDIIAKRTYSSRLKDLLERFEQKYPGITFRYDKKEKAVYVTGSFTMDMQTEELMDKVEELSNCFNRK